MLRKLLLLQLTLLICATVQGQICSYPSAFAELNIGNVRAGLLNGGDFWWNGVDAPKYEFPKVDTSLGQTPIHALFSGGIWLSARDNSNNLKVAAMTFRNQGFDFYPGPINDITGTVTFNSCNFFDRFWEIYSDEIDLHLNNVSLGLPVPISLIPSNILMWPAKGNANITTLNISQDLAPFVDYNDNGIYDPENGDHPETIGNQTFFWVVNDIGGPHTRTGGDPLKVEVHFLAHAFENPSSPLLNSTVYEIKVINKSMGNLSDLKVGLFVDPDLGNFNDDYVGCDTIRDAGFVYNSNAVDFSYGPNPPVISFQFLNQELEAFNFFINSGTSLIQDPDIAIEFDYFLHGLLKNGYPQDSLDSLISKNGFIYPGDPDILSPYSMVGDSSFPGSDLRLMQATGTSSFPAWSSFDLSVAINASLTSAYQPDSFYFQVEDDLDSVLAEYLALKAKNPTTGLTNKNILNNQISISPNPTKNQIRISFGDLEVFEVQLVNVEGRIIQTENTNFGILDISELPEGIYFVKVKAKNGIGIQKVLKK